MNPDSFQQAWQNQSSNTRREVDASPLFQKLRRDQRYFAAVIFWRDVREVIACLLMAALWVYLGVKQSSPWTWYLTVSALLWIAGFMLADRIRHKRQPPEPGETLKHWMESSLAQVEHQIWLLRNVFWWYLLPLALVILAFLGPSAWQERSGGWWTVLAFALVAAIEVIVLAGVHWLNQYAVRDELEPRRQELQALLRSLNDETPAASV